MTRVVGGNLPWPYVQSYAAASKVDRDNFRAAGIEYGRLKADAPIPDKWECDLCDHDFGLDILLITAGVPKPMPSCPYKPDSDHICNGDGWGIVHPADTEVGHIVG
jgi:hypothetical protein